LKKPLLGPRMKNANEGLEAAQVQRRRNKRKKKNHEDRNPGEKKAKKRKRYKARRRRCIPDKERWRANLTMRRGRLADGIEIFLAGLRQNGSHQRRQPGQRGVHGSTGQVAISGGDLFLRERISEDLI